MKLRVLMSAMFVGCLMLSCLWLQGCATTDKPLPDGAPITPVHWQQPWPEETQAFMTSLDQLYQAPSLQALVDEALANHPDLRALALQLKASKRLLTAEVAASWPELSLGVTRDRTKAPEGIGQQWRLGLSTQWELDLWGRIADATASVQWQHEAHQQEWRAARDLMATEVIRQSIALWSGQQLLQVELDHQERLQQMRQIVDERFRKGLAGLEAVTVIQLDLQRTEASLQETRLQIRQTQSQLELLLGRAPGAEPLNLPLPSIGLPPATVPAVVLARRPDVQAAFSQFQAAASEARSAYKALLPSLTLTGSLDRSMPELHDWMDGEVVWNLVGGLSQPLFDRGRRLAVAEAGDWTRDARWWSYRKVVLQALHEVHDALVAETALQTQVQIIAQAVESARAHHQVTLDRYRLGLVDLLDLIDAQEKQLDVLARQIRLQAAQLDNRVLLARALGLGVSS